MSYYISSVKYIIQLMTFNEVETRIYKSWNPSNRKSLIVLLYDTFYMFLSLLK
jgi:hypothetical protein